MPAVSELALRIGWGARESQIASNWDAMEYDVSIDNYKLDLDNFDWEEYDCTGLGDDCKAHRWTIFSKTLPLANISYATHGHQKSRWMMAMMSTNQVPMNVW